MVISALVKYLTTAMSKLEKKEKKKKKREKGALHPFGKLFMIFDQEG